MKSRFASIGRGWRARALVISSFAFLSAVKSRLRGFQLSSSLVRRSAFSFAVACLAPLGVVACGDDSDSEVSSDASELAVTITEDEQGSGSFDVPSERRAASSR